MSYLDSQYDQYFQKDIFPNQADSGSINPFDFSSQYQGLSASSIGTGILKSNNGRLTLDLDGEAFIVRDGVVERVRLGKQSDGSYGLLIKDVNGNNLMQITGNNNVIKSPDGSLELNFNNTQLLVRDAGGLIRVLIGKDIGGF